MGTVRIILCDDRPSQLWASLAKNNQILNDYYILEMIQQELLDDISFT